MGVKQCHGMHTTSTVSLKFQIDIMNLTFISKKPSCDATHHVHYELCSFKFIGGCWIWQGQRTCFKWAIIMVSSVIHVYGYTRGFAWVSQGMGTGTVWDCQTPKPHTIPVMAIHKCGATNLGCVSCGYILDSSTFTITNGPWKRQ